ncbi:Hpt domain-containing protein [Arthrobacter sp. NamB2]|uniref:Hpt domain-containing protein n=1 Tax=Arthrobacter sp. NamB2 TaxID=2576035 RepID=UPI0010C9B510|nr:Hpt domain-containing protein [Arthrobacter sp. NamB2]TKV25907.1 Hpt domain-containing protein [Arthrobacter sp. NamB2]
MSSPPIPPRPGLQQDGGPATLPKDAVGDPVAGGRAAPLIDLRVLEDMEDDFSDPSVVGRFALDFSATLDGKVRRLEQRLQDGDLAGARDAVLSLTTSSVMVGARRLAQAALAVQRFLSAADLDACRRSITLLRACASDTEHELRATYPRRP